MNNINRQFSSKIYKTAVEVSDPFNIYNCDYVQATEDIKSGQRLLVGGFGLVGVPFNLI